MGENVFENMHAYVFESVCVCVFVCTHMKHALYSESRVKDQWTQTHIPLEIMHDVPL